MEIDEISLTDIIPAEYNPRKISDADKNKLSNSLEKFGLVDPIVINLKNNHIIGGHQRYRVLFEEYLNNDNSKNENLKLLKLGDIGWVFTDSDITVQDAAHEKALNLALNKISGDWDFDKLQPLLEELDVEGFDLKLTGFDDSEFKELSVATGNETEVDNVNDDYVEPDDLEVTVQLGDLYQLGNHILLCGDATNKKDINKLISNNKINIILTDPPYGMDLNTDYSVLYKDNNFTANKNLKKSNKFNQGNVDDFNPEMIKNVFDLNVKETFLWGADYYSECILNRNDGSWIVWDKRANETDNEKSINSLDKMFGSSFELCWSKSKHKRNIARVKWAGIFGTEQEFDHKRCHPTQKPVALSVWFLNKYSKENDNVLDLFGGSGSTLLACEETNRSCYMMELDSYYCQIIINRWETFTGKVAKKI